jgi:glycosyltransferase involved in cell wall biosynthesis
MIVGGEVTVVLCTFNGAGYVQQQVRSILAQTEPAAAVILSDDGSIDDTVAIARAEFATAAALGSTVPELTVIENSEPLGVTRNFEQAILRADTELVVLCDQDDVWRPDRIALAAERFASRPDLLFLHSDARLIDDSGQPIGTTLFGALGVTPAEFEAIGSGRAFDVFLRRNLATGATSMVRVDLARTAAPFPVEWVHDEWLAINAAAREGLDLLRDTPVDYRRHAANQIGVKDSTVRNKVSRVLERRGNRNRDLAARSRILADRLGALGDVAVAHREAAMAKAAFETRRAALPSSRLKRAIPVLGLALTGDYARYASRGTTDVLRDLFQPA